MATVAEEPRKRGPRGLRGMRGRDDGGATEGLTPGEKWRGRTEQANLEFDPLKKKPPLLFHFPLIADNWGKNQRIWGKTRR